MGSIFSFLNTFFVGSLLASVVLVVMMLFQFRQRINHLQEKSETMLQIINSIVEKMNIRELELSSSGGAPAATFSGFSSLQDMGTVIEVDENTSEDDREDEESEKENDEDAEESDEEDEEESDEELDEENDEEDGEEDDEEDDEEDEVAVVEGDVEHIERIPLVRQEASGDLPQELDMEHSDEVSQVSVEVPDDISSDIPDDSSLAKLTVAQLRDAVRDKGLASNTSKLRKSELIELLSH